jgi:catechol-2,3-dioxygenase
MSRVTMIQHINIQISHRERSRAWYEQVLGAEFLDRGPELNSGQLQ